MRIFTALTTATVLGSATMFAAPASAGELRLYPYESRENHCAAGLRPISFNGVISCGAPSVSISYQQAKTHAVAKRHIRHTRTRNVSRSSNCAIGTKGCTYD